VDADKVDATYEKGMLKVSLTRAEADKPRKINITGNNRMGELVLPQSRSK